MADSSLQGTDVSDSIENLEKLEAKILKVADLLRRSQAEKRSLVEQLTKIRADLDKQAKSSDGLEREALTLRREREEVRSRIEKLLRQIDEMAKSEPGA
jgi:FtsZ-binding cell division protein ZapB